MMGKEGYQTSGDRVMINDARHLLGIPPIKAKKTAIYKHKNKNGEIIYVGISNNAHNRSARHLSTSEWREEIDSIDVQWMPNRLIAEIKEIELIKELRPKHNVMHNNDEDVVEAVHKRLRSFLEEKKQENDKELANYFCAQDNIDHIIRKIDAMSRRRNTVKNREKITELEEQLDEAISFLEGFEDRDDIDDLLCERAMMQSAPEAYVMGFLVSSNDDREGR
jgi:excinuclease UvrABC nuclease subunit